MWRALKSALRPRSAALRALPQLGLVPHFPAISATRAPSAIAGFRGAVAASLPTQACSWVLSFSLPLLRSWHSPIGVVAATRPQGSGSTPRSIFSASPASPCRPSWLALLLIRLLLGPGSAGCLPSGSENVGDGSLSGPRSLHLVLPGCSHSRSPLRRRAFTRYLRAEYARGAEPGLRADRARQGRAPSAPVLFEARAEGNALIPVVTVIGGLISGRSSPRALITETMFAYPGMGKLTYDLIMGNDFNLADGRYSSSPPS